MIRLILAAVLLVIVAGGWTPTQDATPEPEEPAIKFTIPNAKEWLSQGFVNDDEYSVEIVEVTETKCCHNTVKAKLIQAMTVSAWLKAHKGK